MSTLVEHVKDVKATEPQATIVTVGLPNLAKQNKPTTGFPTN
jgi:hypothetical protein